MTKAKKKAAKTKAKQTPTKKTAARKAASKKTAKKSAAKKTAKKAAPKKAAKKAAPKKTAKKTAPKKTAKKAAPKKSAKKAAPKKTAKKAAPKKTAKKAAPKKTAKKAAPKKAAKKSAPKKTAPKKAAPKKTAKKAAPKKTAPKNTAPKNTARTAPRAVKQAGLLAPDVEKRVLQLLRKARDASDARDAVLDAVDALDPGAVVWDLAARGLLPLDRGGVAEMFTEYPAPSPEAYAAMWSRFKEGWIARVPTQFPGAPSLLFASAYPSIQADPAPWIAARDALPEPLRSVVWMDLIEAGQAVAPPEVLAELRARVLTEPFAPSRVSVIDNLKILGLDDEAVARALLPLLPAELDAPLSSVEPLLAYADAPTLRRLLTAATPARGDAALVGRALRQRHDDPATLVALAQAVRDAFPADTFPDRLVQAIVDVALERSQAVGEAPPAAIDALVTFAWDTSPHASPALAALPPARLQATIRRAVADAKRGWEAQRFFPAIRYAFDEALVEEALAKARDEVRRTVSRANDAPIALGKIGPQALPVFERALAAAGGDASFERDDHRNRWITQLRKAIAVALLEAAEAGDAVDPKWDALLGPHPACLDWNIIDEVFNGGRLFGRLLEQLPEERARAIVAAWIAADPNDKLSVRGSLERELSDERQHLLPAEEGLPARLRRLVEETGSTPDTRIYALEPHDEPDHAAANRVCSAPLGLSDARWPAFEGNRMEHVLTLDLDQAPELRRLAPELAEARALALFISSRDSNEAYTADNDETALLGLSAEELAAGHTEDGGSFSVHAVDVPSAVFADDTEGALAELRSALWKLHGRALGAPIWLQGPEWSGPLLLQFDEGLASMNLGDSGVMYVFPDAAFWQCY